MAPQQTAIDTKWSVERPAPGSSVVILRSATASEPEPADWRQILAGFLRNFPGVTAVGAKRLDREGNVFSMGEFVVHSKGFHHHGAGVPGRWFRFVEDADLVAGGVLAVDEQAFEHAGGEALLHDGELGAIHLGLALRAAGGSGGRCIVVPQVVVTDSWTPAPSPDEEDQFRGRWGFDWKAADLDEVRRAHPGSGLLWNIRFLAPGMPFEKYRDRGPLVWESYKQAEVFRRRADHLALLGKKICPKGRLLDVGCGDGFFSHLIAQQGVEVVGVDPEELGIEQARKQTAGQRYPNKPPVFSVGRGDALPIEEGSVQAATLMDVIEHLPNPVAVLRCIARTLALGGKFMVVTPSWQFGGSSDPVYHLTEYTMAELVRQVGAIPGLRVTDTGTIGGVYRDAIVIAEKM